MPGAHRRYFKARRFSDPLEAVIEKPHRLCAKGALLFQPGAAPQELAWRFKRALKARVQRSLELNRACSAASLDAIDPGALPQAADDGAPLALAKYKEGVVHCVS
jgi:hypothetical protein